MGFRASLVTLTLIAIVSGGCANRPRLRRDPFDVPAGNRDTAFDGRVGVAERDTARDVSTSPATDPFLGGVADRGNNANLPRADSKPQEDLAASDRAFPATNDSVPPPVPATQSSEPPTRFAGQSSAPAATSIRDQYESIRRRLDAAGAQSIRSEKDPQSGKFLVYCEVPFPKQPELARAFEASDEDELRAMRAVTQAVEKWVTDGHPQE